MNKHQFLSIYLLIFAGIFVVVFRPVVGANLEFIIVIVAVVVSVIEAVREIR